VKEHEFFGLNTGWYVSTRLLEEVPWPLNVCFALCSYRAAINWETTWWAIIRVETNIVLPLKFRTTRELLEAIEALEACMKEGQQGQVSLGKWKDTKQISNRPPFPKKGKCQFSQFKKEGGSTYESTQSSRMRLARGQSYSQGGPIGRTLE